MNHQQVQTNREGRNCNYGQLEPLCFGTKFQERGQDGEEFDHVGPLFLSETWLFSITYQFLGLRNGTSGILSKLSNNRLSPTAQYLTENANPKSRNHFPTQVPMLPSSSDQHQ
jgi:hypothetical protein